MKRVTLQTARDDVAESHEPSHSRRSSVSSTNWENARYKRRSGSYTSLSNGTPPHSGGFPTPIRPHASRTQTAPVPIARPILKPRNPTPQQMAYHFRNGSTGHLNTPHYHYRDRQSNQYQPHYRKVASASHASVIKASMYGQYGWYNTSRQNSTVSLDSPQSRETQPTHDRRASRQSIYGQTHVSESQQSLDTPHDRHTPRQSIYGQPSVTQSEQSLGYTSYHPLQDSRTPSSRQASVSRRTTSPQEAGSSNQRPTSSLSNRSSRPLPQEPPVLPPPELNPGWPPRGWHVYVSAMTQDYLYGSSNSQRPELDDYVFDQDSLTFVKAKPPAGDSNPNLNPSRETIPQAYAYEPPPDSGGQRGRATQSLDIPRRSPVVDTFSYPYHRPNSQMTNSQSTADPKKRQSKLVKKRTKSKSTSSAKASSPVEPIVSGANSNATPHASWVNIPTATAAASAPNSPVRTKDPNSSILSFFKSPSTLSVTSKKSSKSNGSKGLSGWRKRSKSGSGTEIEGNDAEVPPPLPALPGLNLPGTNLRLEPWCAPPEATASDARRKTHRYSVMTGVSTIPATNGHAGYAVSGLDESTVRGTTKQPDSPALCDNSIKDYWQAKAGEEGDSGPGGAAMHDDDVPREVVVKGKDEPRLTTPTPNDITASNTTATDSGSSDHDTPTDTDPSVSGAHVVPAEAATNVPRNNSLGDVASSRNSSFNNGSSRSPYPSPPSSSTGHSRSRRSESTHTRTASAAAPSNPRSSSTSSLTPTPSPAPTRSSTLISHVGRRSSTRIGKGAYILDSLEGTMLSSPYPAMLPPQQQQTPGWVVQPKRVNVSSGGRSASNPASSPTASGPQSSLSFASMNSAAPSRLSVLRASGNANGRGSGTTNGNSTSGSPYLRPQSSRSLTSVVTSTTTTRRETPIPTRGAASLDLNHSSTSPSQSPSPSVRPYSPYPPHSYTPMSSSTPPSSTYYSPSVSPSPSKTLMSMTTSGTVAPAKEKRSVWKRWTSISPSSPSSKSRKVALNPTPVFSKSPPASDVGHGSGYGGAAANGEANGGGDLGNGSLIWSAPSVSNEGAFAKLRKKRK